MKLVSIFCCHGACYFGNSFVNKLETFAQRDWQNSNIDPSKVVVSYNGISGGTFKDFRKKEYTNCLKSENLKKCDMSDGRQ